MSDLSHMSPKAVAAELQRRLHHAKAQAVISNLQRTVERAETQAVVSNLQRSIERLNASIPPKSPPPPPAKKKEKAPVPLVKWIERDSNGNVIHTRPRSAMRPSNQAAGPSGKAEPGGCNQKTVPPVEADPVAELTKFIEQEKKKQQQEEAMKICKAIDDLIPPESQWKAPPPAKKAKAPQPLVRWVNRDCNGNIIYERPRSSRKRSNEAGPSQKADSGGGSQKSSEVRRSPLVRPVSAPDKEDVESFIREFEQQIALLKSMAPVEAPAPPPPLLACNDWSTRKRRFLEKWREQKLRLVNGVAAKEHVAPHVCQECAVSPAAVRCHDCQPRPFLCAECDVVTHASRVLHNRDAMIAGFFQPLPPTTCIVDKALRPCERLVPVRMPDEICSCPKEALKVMPGETIALVTMHGQYDLSMPDLTCEACKATWTGGVDALIRTNYWPSALQFATVFATDVFSSFKQMKTASPGLSSCRAFLKMLDQRTAHFGRTGKISADGFQKSFDEWDAVHYEVENVGKETERDIKKSLDDMSLFYLGV